VLEALLKRVDGIEKRLQTDRKAGPPTNETTLEHSSTSGTSSLPQQRVSTDISNSSIDTPAFISSVEPEYVLPSARKSHGLFTNLCSESALKIYPDLLLDTYFARLHGKPYHILDEASIRQRSRNNQVSSYLAHAIYSVSAR